MRMRWNEIMILCNPCPQKATESEAAEGPNSGLRHLWLVIEYFGSVGVALR